MHRPYCVINRRRPLLRNAPPPITASCTALTACTARRRPLLRNAPPPITASCTARRTPHRTAAHYCVMHRRPLLRHAPPLLRNATG
jgi:hypothetical protein